MKYSNVEEGILEAILWTGGPEQSEDPNWLVRAIESGFEFPGACFACRGISGKVSTISIAEGYQLLDCAEEELKANGYLP